MNRILPSADKWLMAAIVVGGIILMRPVAAQSAAPKADANKQNPVQLFMQKRNELQKLQEQLAHIQQQTVEKRPTLKKQQEDFRQLMFAKMKAKGHTPEKDIEHIKQLEAQLHGKDVDAQKRNDLLIQLRETSMKLQKGQQEVLKDKDLQASRKVLAKAILDAMKEEDPKTDQLISQAYQKEVELVALQKQINGAQADDPSPKAH